MTSIPLHLDFLYDDNPWDTGVHLFNVFNDLIQPSASQLSVREAAEKINLLHPSNEPEHALYREDTISFFLELSEMHVKLASQVPYQRPEMDRLVDLFFELQNLPLFEGSGFGAATIEEWFQYDARAMASQTDQDQERVRFRNLSSFLARLVKAGFEDSEMLYAFITLQEALEYEFEAANASHVLASEYLVPMAAEWIIMAGEAFSLDEEDADGYAGQGEPLWEGEPRFSLERWQFWTRRFGVFAGCEMLTEETRNAAKLAAEKMKCIEEQEHEAWDL